MTEVVSRTFFPDTNAFVYLFVCCYKTMPKPPQLYIWAYRLRRENTTRIWAYILSRENRDTTQN